MIPRLETPGCETEKMPGKWTKIPAMNYLRRLLLLSCALPATAFALTLGEPSGQAVIGRTLAITVPLSGTDASRVGADCIRILPADGTYSDASLRSPLVRVENGSVIITTARAIYEPVLSFRLRVECGFQFEREYLLLPSPPESVTPATVPGQTPVTPATVPGQTPVTPAAVPRQTPVTPATVPRQILPIPPAIPRAPAQPSGRDYVLPEQTTLRLMSRKRYPLDSRARVTFIHRVAAANPEEFDNVEAAFDKPLTAGVQLRLPANLPRQKSTAVPVSPEPVVPATVKATPRERAKSAGKGRLIIGADVPTNKTVAELEANIDRLVNTMNDQLLIQTSMTDRLKVLEGEFAQARQTAAMLKSVNQRLESDIRDLREEQTRNSYIQLVLAILLGGFAVASFLLWRGRERRPAADSHSYPLY